MIQPQNVRARISRKFSFIFELFRTHRWHEIWRTGLVRLNVHLNAYWVMDSLTLLETESVRGGWDKNWSGSGIGILRTLWNAFDCDDDPAAPIERFSNTKGSTSSISVDEQSVSNFRAWCLICLSIFCISLSMIAMRNFLASVNSFIFANFALKIDRTLGHNLRFYKSKLTSSLQIADRASPHRYHLSIVPNEGQVLQCSSFEQQF